MPVDENIPEVPVPTVATGMAGLTGSSFGNKRAREVWVGNLLQGAVAPQHLKEFFTQMFNALPEYQEKYQELINDGKSCVRDIQMVNNAAYAFVEFWTEELAATAIGFNQVEFMGRPMKVGRPTGFKLQGPEPNPLNLNPLRNASLLPGQVNLVEDPQQNKKQRELYFGNLPVGQLNGEAIRQLVTPALQLLPEYNPELGGPVVSVYVADNGMFAFVEFQNERLATAAMPIFNGMEIFGRKMAVGRPTGYMENGQPVVLDPMYAQSIGDITVTTFPGQEPGQNVSGAMAAGALAAQGLNFG